MYRQWTALLFEPTLGLLADICDFSKIYRRVESRATLVSNLRQWAGRDDWKFPALYLWFLGFERSVRVDDATGAGFTRTDLPTNPSTSSEDHSVADTVVHFVACSTLAAEEAETRRSLRDTNAFGGQRLFEGRAVGRTVGVRAALASGHATWHARNAADLTTGKSPTRLPTTECASVRITTARQVCCHPRGGAAGSRGPVGAGPFPRSPL